MSAVSVVTFGVHGDPAPQGSKRHVGGGRMVDMSKKFGPWRDAVEAAAVEQMLRLNRGEPMFPSGPVELDVVFAFRMPASAPKADREQGHAWRAKQPDLDKLLRSTCDALTASRIIGDDAQIVAMTASKIERYDMPPGARITLRPVGTSPEGAS